MAHRISSHLFSFGQLLFVGALLSLGVGLIGFDGAPNLRAQFVQLLQENQAFFFLPLLSFIGMVFVALGLGFLSLFYFLHRGHFYRLALRPNAVTLEEALIGSYVKKFWSGKFPDSACRLHVKMHPGNVIEIVAEVSSLFPTTHEELLIETEKELGDVLSKHLGHVQEFFLTLVVK